MKMACKSRIALGNLMPYKMTSQSGLAKNLLLRHKVKNRDNQWLSNSLYRDKYLKPKNLNFKNLNFNDSGILIIINENKYGLNVK